MDLSTKCLIFLSILTYVLASDEISRNISSNNTKIGRTGRKNYGPYQPQPPRDYGDNGDNSEDSKDNSEPITTNDNQPQNGNYPNFGNYKGYDQYSNHGPSNYPVFAPNYKGFPFPSSGGSSASPDQMMGMMMALSNLNDATKPAESGFLTKLLSDPSTLASAAFIPLSIMAAAFVPLLMNYVIANNAPQVVSTTANNKEARDFDVSMNLEMLMEQIASFARAVDNDRCIQMTICKVASGASKMPVPDYVKKAVSAIAVHLAKDNWMDNLRVRNLIDAIKQGNCVNVCNNPKIIFK
ncbi:uncharacterized protein CDAR_520301 [Caerostris darwini]|uniref:Uncharacterized protein n=1 Tax=Caerostris darwini TaxID=1538125 RepID=A0AAV4Q7L1_9ARAC|nr:uncharacterized protein CDAR_520301 [Caerostris darwini]